MKIVKVNKNEFNCLMNDNFLHQDWKNLISSVTTHCSNAFVITLSEERADELRDLCGDQLQMIGFDENDELNSHGAVLESLIDKLYC